MTTLLGCLITLAALGVMAGMLVVALHRPRWSRVVAFVSENPVFAALWTAATLMYLAILVQALRSGAQ